MVDFEIIETIYERFPPVMMPFLTESLSRLKQKKPYIGLKFVHNIHLTLSTICKLIPLLHSGAEVIVTVTKELQIDPKARELLEKANIAFIEPQNLIDDADITLDCCAGLINVIHPRIGAVELTQSGKMKFQSSRVNYPVISVDESCLKQLETLLGTGNGFIRAFPRLTSIDMTDKKFVLFGYGKVGHGVVKALQEHTNNIVVIEKDPTKIDKAFQLGLRGISVYEIERVRKELKDAFCAVTATGIEGVISEFFERDDFSACTYLANIGSEDEFGSKFPEDEVLSRKKPINFSLEEPTLVKFLDPIFYAHNLAIDLLLSGKFKKGFHRLPENIDLEIVNKWAKYYNQDVSEILGHP